MNWNTLTIDEKQRKIRLAMARLIDAANDRWNRSYEAAHYVYEFSKSAFEAEKEAFDDWSVAGYPDPEEDGAWSKYINFLFPVTSPSPGSEVVRTVADLMLQGPFEKQVERLYTEGALEESFLSRLFTKAWTLANAAPEVAGAAVDITGAPKWVTHLAYALSLIGDWAVPGIPVGSAAVLLSVLPFRPRAPLQAVRKVVSDFLSTKQQESLYETSSTLQLICVALNTVKDYVKFFTVLAVMMEGRGFRDAVSKTVEFMSSRYANNLR